MRYARDLALLLAVLVVGCGGNESGEQGPIRIGSVLSITGGAAFLGDPMLKSLQLYVERINAAGGVNGRRPLGPRRSNSAAPAPIIAPRTAAVSRSYC